jgi:hypothetical protein
MGEPIVTHRFVVQVVFDPDYDDPSPVELRELISEVLVDALHSAHSVGVIHEPPGRTPYVAFVPTENHPNGMVLVDRFIGTDGDEHLTVAFRPTKAHTWGPPYALEVAP